MISCRGSRISCGFPGLKLTDFIRKVHRLMPGFSRAVNKSALSPPEGINIGVITMIKPLRLRFTRKYSKKTFSEKIEPMFSKIREYRKGRYMPIPGHPGRGYTTRSGWID